MGLSLQPTRRLGGKIATLIAVFALVVQPMYGMVAAHVASAIEQPASSLDAEIHSVRFTAVDHGYKGVSVDQRLRGYTDVSSYKATLHRADGSSVSRVGKQPVLDIINKGGNQALTVPFDFAGSPEGAYWSSLSADWTHSTKPTGLTIELQSTSLGPVKFSTPDSQSLVESNHTYLSLLAQRPVVNVADGTPIRLKSSQRIQILASDNQGLRRVVGNVRDSSWGLAKSTQSNANGAHTHTHNVSLSGLTDGEYTLVYNARDTDEILSETKNFRFTIDNTGPEIQQLTPENNAIVGGKLSMEFEVTDPSDIRQVNIHLFQGGVSKLVVPLADTGNDVWGVSDYDITELDNGSYTFISRAVDGLGNLRAGTGTTHGTIILDKSAPGVSIESLNINITPKVSKSGVLNATIKADDNLAIKQIDANIYNKQLNKIEQGIGNLAEYALPEKKRDATVEISNQHLSSLTDGEYVLKVAVHDYSGKVAYAYKTFTIDTTAPTVQVTGVTPIHRGNIGGSNIGGSNVKVSFRIDDASEISLDRTYVMFADGPGTSRQHKESSKIYLRDLGEPIDGIYTATFDTKKFVHENYTGKYNLQFTMVDVHGNNTSTKPIEYRNILIDNSGPGSALSTPASGSYVQGKEAKLTFTLSDDTGVSSVRVRLTNTVTGFEKWYNVTDFSDTEGSLTFDTTELPEGEYTITIRPVDSFGQPRSGANKGTVIVDRTAPTITRWIVGGKNYASPYTLTDGQLFNSKNINVQFKDNSKLAKVVINDHEIVGKWSDQKSFDAQWYMNQYAKEGSNTIALYDEAGNKTTYAFVIDSVAPSVTDVAQVYETREGGRIGVTLTFSERINPSSLAQGWYEVAGSNGTQFVKRYYRTQDQTVTFRDIAGNVGNYDLTVDMTAPTLTVNGSTESGRYFGPGRVGIESRDSDLDRIVITQKRDNNEFTHRQTYERGRNFTNTANISWLGDGMYRIQAFDIVGNPSELIEFTVDTAKPVLHLPDLSVISGEQTFAITQTEANPDRTYVEYMQKDANGDYRKVHGQWFNNTNTFNYNIDTTQWDDGEYQVKISTWDKANNHSGASFQLTVDNTAPQVIVNVSEDGRSFSGTSIDAGVGAREYVTLNFYLLDSNGNAVRNENGNQISRHSAQVAVDENGNWSYRISDEDLSKFETGEHYRVAVRAWDTIGNNDAMAQGYVFGFVAQNGDEEESPVDGGDDITQTPTQAAAPQSPVLAQVFTTPQVFPAGDTVIDEATDEDEDETEDSGEVAAATTGDAEQGDVLAAEDTKDQWSLVNLLLTIAIAAASLFALIGLAGKREGEKNVVARVLSIVPALGAGAVLYFVEDFSGPMGWVNIWTLLVGGLVLVQMIILASTRSQTE